MSPNPATEKSAYPLRQRLLTLGQELQSALQAVVQRLPPEAQRTTGLSSLGRVNKVFASRLLKALRQEDPMAVVHHLPGPEPLRRFLDGMPQEHLSPRIRQQAKSAVESFQQLIETEAGDRAALQTMMSNWLGDARQEFELRRRQAAYKAISELHGASVDLNLSAAILHPSANEDFLDLVWLMSMIGLQRLRPGAQLRVDTRLMSDEGHQRQPKVFIGEELEQILPEGLGAYCPHGAARIEAEQLQGTMNYFLGGEDFGPHRRSDMLLVEANREELRRYRPEEPNRRSYVYSNPTPPSQGLVLDLFLHKSLLDEEAPELLIYDTAGVGPRDPNDPLCRFDVLEQAEELDYADSAHGFLPVSEYPPYERLLGHVLERLDWNPKEFHLWRARVAYPLHSSQVTVAFKPRRS